MDDHSRWRALRHGDPPYVWGELFYDSRSDAWSRTEWIGGAVFPLNRRVELEGYFDYEHDSQREPNRLIGEVKETEGFARKREDVREARRRHLAAAATPSVGSRAITILDVASSGRLRLPDYGVRVRSGGSGGNRDDVCDFFRVGHEPVVADSARMSFACLCARRRLCDTFAAYLYQSEL